MQESCGQPLRHGQEDPLAETEATAAPLRSPQAEQRGRSRCVISAADRRQFRQARKEFRVAQHDLLPA